MTNEEKAKEFKVNDVCCVWNGGCPNVYNAAIDMAEWKEKQMINKACEWLKEHARDYFFAEYCGEELTGEVSMNDNFIEAFQQAMEE